MQKNFKPKGYNSLSPYLIVEDSTKMIDFLQQIFNATVLSKQLREDGTLQHGELKIDDSVLMLSEATEEFAANQFLLHVYVPDVYQTYKTAIDYGCIALQAPIQKEDPDIRGMFQDFAGNVWAIGMLAK